jgi:hypothetical protein
VLRSAVAQDDVVPEEEPIRREDVLAITDALACIRADLQEVVRLLKRKSTRRRSPEERAADEARAEEQARKLRELVAKGEAELEAKRAAEEASGQ